MKNKLGLMGAQFGLVVLQESKLGETNVSETFIFMKFYFPLEIPLKSFQDIDILANIYCNFH